MPGLEGKEAFEQLEHADHGRRTGGFVKRAAVLVAILAGLLAIATLLSNRSSQQTILRQGEASDAYNEFEANSTKSHIDGGYATILRSLAAGTPNESAARTAADKLEKGVREKYDPNKARLLAKAQALEHDRDVEETRHRDLQVSEGALEIGIVLTSMALLTGFAVMLYASVGLGLVGLAILLLAQTVS